MVCENITAYCQESLTNILLQGITGEEDLQTISQRDYSSFSFSY